MRERVLIVDDDPVQRRLLASTLDQLGYEAAVAAGGDQAVSLLTGEDAPAFDCVVLDLVMPDLDGLGVLAKIRAAGLDLPVVVACAASGIDNVMSAIRAGATDFIVKPVGVERLQVSLRNALAARALKDELARLARGRAGTLTIHDIVSRNAQMRVALRTARKAAASALPVLIEGETGVGKELLARAIHGSGERRSGPFVTVRCGRSADLESRPFGRPDRDGVERLVDRLAEADGGTVFLDGVACLAQAAQAELLRLIERGEVTPAAARRPVHLDVRVIAAGEHSLLTQVRAGRFREDLYYRLHVFPISIPPLRERPEDIPDLVRHFVARFAAEDGKCIRAVAPTALDRLIRCPWPGNVRQLENTIFRAVALTEGEEIGLDALPQLAAQASRDAEDAPPRHELPLMLDEGAAAGLVPGLSADARHATRGGLLPLFGPDGEIRPLDQIEAEIIRFTVGHYRNRMSEAARRLRIGRSTLYRKLESLGLMARAEGLRHEDMAEDVADG